MKFKEYAKDLRQRQTTVEKLLWYHLRNRRLLNCKFRRQHTIKPYIVDFVCLEIKLIIELDGGQHSQQQTYDDMRTRFLNSRGFDVLRYWNNQVALQFNAILSDIYSEVSRRLDLRNSSSCPSPTGEGTVGQSYEL